MNVSDQEGEEYQTIDEYQRENRILKSKIDNYKENLNIFDDLISVFKNEICELKKEKEIQSEKCNLLNTQNSQYQNEIIVLKSEITQFKSKSDLAISEQIDKQLDTAKQLNEWKNKTNALEMQIVKLKSENEKAVLYLNDYIKNFKQFEDHLKTVLNEKKKINEQKMQLESELNNLKKQQFKQSDSNDNCTVSVQTSNPDETETEKLKRENSELVSKCANLSK
jgi:chromosome segregation ATPase